MVVRASRDPRPDDREIRRRNKHVGVGVDDEVELERLKTGMTGRSAGWREPFCPGCCWPQDRCCCPHGLEERVRDVERRARGR